MTGRRETGISPSCRRVRPLMRATTTCAPSRISWGRNGTNSVTSGRSSSKARSWGAGDAGDHRGMMAPIGRKMGHWCYWSPPRRGPPSPRARGRDHPVRSWPSRQPRRKQAERRFSSPPSAGRFVGEGFARGCSFPPAGGRPGASSAAGHAAGHGGRMCGQRMVRLLGLLGLALLLLAAFTPLPNRLSRWAATPPGVGPAEAIVVLGAGLQAEGELNHRSLRRAVYGIALYHGGLAPLLVFSGSDGRGPSREADVRAALA